MYKKNFPSHEFPKGITHEITKENVMAKSNEVNSNLDFPFRKMQTEVTTLHRG